MKSWHKVLFVLFAALAFSGVASVAKAQDVCPACGNCLAAGENSQVQAKPYGRGQGNNRGGLEAGAHVGQQRMLRQNRRLGNGNGQALNRRNGQPNPRQMRAGAVDEPRGRQLRSRAMVQSRRGMGQGAARNNGSRPVGRGMAAGMGQGRNRARGMGMGMGRMNNRLSQSTPGLGRNRLRQRAIQ